MVTKSRKLKVLIIEIVSDADTNTHYHIPSSLIYIAWWTERLLRFMHRDGYLLV